MSIGSAHVFIPVGPTSRFNANTTAANGVQPSGDTKQPAGVYRQYRIVQHGNDTVWASFGSSNTAAANAAVIPTNATTGATNAYSVPPNTPVFITAPVGQYWTGIVATTNTAVFITPGKGRA
jgi:hypothetical protein